ncbi:MAG TPA: twin-arginine translocase subunit TatC [Streptosporangiaceae bacterium]|nr:twin-arginine translocase subunit TatC [Streptosporangiaceae bacterium]
MAMQETGAAGPAGDSPAPRPGIRLPGNRSNPDGSMPLMEHIRELRNRVFKALLFATIGAIAGWYLYPHIWHFIEAPYCRLHLPTEAVPGQVKQGGCHLYVTGVFDSLFLRLKVAIIAGVIMTSPLWMYQLWAFIAPGLYRRERRWAYFFAGSAIPLFVIGGSLAYFAMTKGLHFLLDLVPSNVVPIITIDTYLSYALAMLAIFGLAFELPLVFVLLNLAHVLTHERFARWRRMIIFLVFAFAAVATPSPDPISMLLLAVPCVALVELAEVFAYFNDKRRARLLAADPYPGLTPEEAAALEQDDAAAAVDAGATQKD